MKRIELSIEGMTCAGCGEQVAEALRSVEDIQEVQLDDWSEGRAVVTVARDMNPDYLTAAVAKVGYSASAERRRSAAPTPSEGVEEDPDYDLVVVGGGSAAFAAALKASELGRSVLIVNDGPGAGGLPIGGTCVNVGCVPSKALIRAAEARHRAAHHPFDGIHTESAVTDFAALTDQVQTLTNELRQKKYLEVIAGDPNVTVREDRARLVGDHAVEVNSETVTGRRILIATGARTFVPEIPGLEETGYLTNEELYRLETLPEHLIVLGGGYIALENAQAFARLGSEVTVLQRSGQILSREDEDVAEAIAGYLREEGLTIRTNTEVQGVQRANGTIQLETEVDGTAQIVRGTDLLVATGLQARTDQLGLEALGIGTRGRGFLEVGETLQTAAPTVYGAGDVIGDPAFVYTAAREGEIAAENALTGSVRDRRAEPLPWVIFTDPQVAGVGLGEREAREQDLDVEVAKVPLDQVPRALAARDTRGFIKLLRERETGRLVGARIVAPEGGELLTEVALAIRQKLTAADLTDLLHPYLTLSEGIKLAALAFEKDVEKLSCCAA